MKYPQISLFYGRNNRDRVGTWYWVYVGTGDGHKRKKKKEKHVYRHLPKLNLEMM